MRKINDDLYLNILIIIYQQYNLHYYHQHFAVRCIIIINSMNWQTMIILIELDEGFSGKISFFMNIIITIINIIIIIIIISIIIRIYCWLENSIMMPIKTTSLHSEIIIKCISHLASLIWCKSFHRREVPWTWPKPCWPRSVWVRGWCCAGDKRCELESTPLIDQTDRITC